MPDKVEQIMKKIHVLFARSEEYNGSPDKVVISKKEMFDILEELNVAIYDVLDQYEATTRSKERARLDMERVATEIISDAKKAAEDVNAASLIYTDTMIEEIRLIVAETAAEAKNQLETMKEKFDERIQLLAENKEEVKNKLNELHENEFYLEALKEKRNREAENIKQTLRDIEDIEDESEEETIKHAEYVIKVNEAYRSKIPGAGKDSKAKSKKSESKADIEHDAIADDVQDISKLETAADSEADFAYGEPHVNPDDFDLDGEYYRWKEEQGEQSEQESNTKKPKRFLFGRKKENKE